MEKILGNYKAEFIDIGEGYNGEYDPTDPNDVALLRFDVYELVDGEWETIDDTSYCTAMPVDTPDDVLDKALTHLLEEMSNATSKKKCGETLSWMNPAWY